MDNSVAILIALIILSIFCFLYQNAVLFVRKNSVAYKLLCNLNLEQKSNFKTFIPNEDFYKNCNSKAQYDNFNSNNFILAIIDENLNKYTELIKIIHHNKKAYEIYNTKVNSILNNNYNYEQMVKNSILGIYLFKKIEMIEFRKEILKPLLDFSINLFVSYTSPQGRNHYSKSYKFLSNNIEYLLSECIKARQYKQSAKYQRSLVTDKLRYQVLNRDKHKCTICGASAKDGAKLHVDHIIPVSKGGLSTMDNLRTLCDRCNLGKGASYNPNGYN